MSTENINTSEKKLLTAVKELEDEESALEMTLAKLMQEKAKFQETEARGQDQDERLSASTLKHYDYILPLMKEIYLLELKIKEQKKAYEEKQWKCDAARLGQELLAASLTKEECVLKRWSEELIEKPGEGGLTEEIQITNKSYKAWHCEDCLKECLSFTVLTQGVHVGLKINTETPCQRIHFLCPSQTKLDLNSDTFVPNLEEKLVSTLSAGGPIADVVSLVATHIQEDMAPYVIIVPTKKKAKSKKVKPPLEEQAANE